MTATKPSPRRLTSSMRIGLKAGSGRIRMYTAHTSDVAILKRAHQKMVAQVEKGEGRMDNLPYKDQNQLLTMASIIEKRRRLPKNATAWRRYLSIACGLACVCKPTRPLSTVWGELYWQADAQRSGDADGVQYLRDRRYAAGAHRRTGRSLSERRGAPGENALSLFCCRW